MFELVRQIDAWIYIRPMTSLTVVAVKIGIFRIQVVIKTRVSNRLLGGAKFDIRQFLQSVSL